MASLLFIYMKQVVRNTASSSRSSSRGRIGFPSTSDATARRIVANPERCMMGVRCMIRRSEIQRQTEVIEM